MTDASGMPTQEELYKLYEIGRAVNSSLEPKTVLQFIMQVTTELFMAEAGSIMLLQEDGTLTIEVAQGLGEEVIANTKVPLGAGIAGWVAKEGKPLLLDGKVEDPRFKFLVDRKDSVSSSLCVPLKTKEKIIGVLILRNPSSSPRFTQEHLHFLSAIADQTAIAIENARLYRAEKNRLEEMVRLNRAISDEKMKVDAILSSIADPLVATSLDGTVLLINPAAERMFGIDRTLLLGRSYEAFFAGLGLETYFKKVMKKGRLSSTEITIEKPTKLDFKVFIAPIRAADGSVQGVIFLLQDITELKRAAEMKSRFVSMVTHDLKTPLTSIQGFVDMILRRNLPPEKVGGYLNIIEEETERLIRMIENLLESAKLESGEFSFHRRPMDLVKLIKLFLEAFPVPGPRHKIVFHDPGKPVLVIADEDLIFQVLQNLLSNAVKYSPKGGNVVLEIRMTDDFAEVDVADQGIGISEKKLPHLFERFYRVESKASQGIQGTGLGLANVKYIIEALGGTLRVKSEEGRGSIFTISLPLASQE